MCDYSLEAFKSREARVGDQLVSGHITNPDLPPSYLSWSFTRGLHEVSDNTCAVCLQEGTEVAFKDEPVRFFGWPLFAKWKTATFKKLQAKDRYSHRDALVFPDGKVRLLHNLRPGQRLVVLQLPSKKVDGQKPWYTIEPHSSYDIVRQPQVPVS